MRAPSRSRERVASTAARTLRAHSHLHATGRLWRRHGGRCARQPARCAALALGACAPPPAPRRPPPWTCTRRRRCWSTRRTWCWTCAARRSTTASTSQNHLSRALACPLLRATPASLPLPRRRWAAARVAACWSWTRTGPWRRLRPQRSQRMDTQTRSRCRAAGVRCSARAHTCSRPVNALLQRLR